MSESSSGSSSTRPPGREPDWQATGGARSSEPPEDSEQVGKVASAARRLFDLRLLIGVLFVIYGVLLTIYSFFDSPGEIRRAAGIHVNLWLGLFMLALGLLFLLWARLSPQRPPEPGEPTEQPNE